MEEHIIRVDNHKCIGCNICVKDCPTKNIMIADMKAVIKEQGCLQCAHCVAICPHGAVSMSGFDDGATPFDSKQTINPDELLFAIQSRRSIRQFKSKPIEEDIIKKIIEAGRWTPSAKNAQSVSYLVLRDKKAEAEAIALRFLNKILPFLKILKLVNKNESKTVNENFFFKGAPIAILVISKDTVSASLASSNMALMAESHNLGVLYSGFFAKATSLSSSLRKAIGLNRKDKVVTALVIGYPAVKYYRTAQKEGAKISWK